MVSKNARCGLCFEILDGSREIWECGKDGIKYRELYCYYDSSNEPGGNCWEKRAVEDFPEMEPWLHLSFECDGCVPTDEGECCCTNGF